MASIQIASLIGFLGSQEHKIYPFLVIVPNSNINNWVREFEKWVPHMRVVSLILLWLGLSWWQVPYYGLSSCKSIHCSRGSGDWYPARKVISKYELYRKGLQGKAAGLKACVLLSSPLMTDMWYWPHTTWSPEVISPYSEISLDGRCWSLTRVRDVNHPPPVWRKLMM